MKSSELRTKTVDELRDELRQLKQKSFNLRFQQATGQLQDTASVRTTKRMVARVKTILNEAATSELVGQSHLTIANHSSDSERKVGGGGDEQDTDDPGPGIEP